MTLTLTVLRCPDRVPPQTRALEGGEFSIGRGSENDWVLPDPDRHLSKRHCLLAYRAGYWQLTDTSANGTYLNHDPDPVGPARPRDLRDGDRLRLGPYEIEARIAEARPERRPPPPETFASEAFAPGAFAPEPARYTASEIRLNPFEEDAGAGRHGQLLPPDFDALMPEAEPGFRGQTQQDHAPAFEDAFRPLPSAPIPPAQKVIPDDWDLDLVPKSAPPPPEPVSPPPQAVPLPADPPPPVVTQARAASESALLAAFLDGACIEGGTPADPEATMRALGRTFRALVAGLRQAIMARAEIKGEFRIERTIIRARGNNPLKFSADDDDALAALLSIGRVTDMDPARAVTEALRDMRLHELASVNAMQSAVRALLTQFAPGRLRTQADEAGGLALVPAQRKARAWDLFEKLHNDTARALEDDFDSVFGRAFARAYEQAMRELGGSAED